MDVNKNAFLTKAAVKGLVNSTSEEQISYSVNRFDILITRTSETKKEIALSSCLLENISKCVFSGFLLRARPKNCEIINPVFMVYLLRSPTYRKRLIKASTETSRALINSKNLGSIKIQIPSKLLQDEIASLLSKIDLRINVQNKIIETLNSLIKPLFDAIPITACEKFALCKLGRYVPAETMSWDDMTDDGAPAIIYGQLFTDYSLIIDEVYGRSSKRGCLSSGNDVLFPASTTVDNLSLISPASLKIKGVNLGGDMFSLSLHDWVDSDYLSLLINLDYRRDLAKLAQGSTIIHLHWEDIKDFELPLPPLADQKRVATACKCVLERIKIEKVLLNELIIQKQFLLKNLFI